jgi:hypothetical protein
MMRAREAMHASGLRQSYASEAARARAAPNPSTKEAVP